jgi:hypothetical protein
MMQVRYPALKFVMAYGTATVAIVALAILFATFFLALPAFGWPAVPLGCAVAALLFIFGKSYVELVKIITEMMVPG